MNTRIVVLVLSLMMAILPSWAGACAMSGSTAQGMQDMPDHGMGSGDCDSTGNKGPVPTSPGCPMSALCTVSVAVPLQGALVSSVIVISSSVVVPVEQHYVSTLITPPLRPPIA